MCVFQDAENLQLKIHVVTLTILMSDCSVNVNEFYHDHGIMMKDYLQWMVYLLNGALGKNAMLPAAEEYSGEIGHVTDHSMVAPTVKVHTMTPKYAIR